MTSIKEAIRKIGGVEDAVRIFDAQVVSVDTSKRMCVVTSIGGSSSNTLPVRLMASTDDGCLCIPKVDSTVVVAASDYVLPYVTMFSEIESIVWLGGEYEGVPIVKHPTNANKGLVARMNELENIVKDLILKYNAHTHAGVTTGAGTSAISTQLSTSVVSLTQQTDIEHPNIKQ